MADGTSRADRDLNCSMRIRGRWPDRLSWIFGGLDSRVRSVQQPFLNIYDKGYRARDVCRRHGQLTAQPAFCKSDKRFTGSNTLYSASIASDRGGNERAILVSKRSGVIKRGFKAGMDVKRFQDTWLTWDFQSNFMFNPVL